MSTDIATIGDAYSAEIAALLGQNTGSSGSTLPRLQPNTDHVVEINGVDYNVPAGAFKVRDTAGNMVYLKTPVFRPIMQRFLWQKYDETANENKGGYVANTIYVADHKTDPLDNQGGIACGKLRGKAARDEANLSPSQKLIQKAVQSFRVVFGLVSGEGVLATGETVTLTNHPCELKLRGVNYMPFGEAVEDKLKIAKRLLPQVELKLSTTRHKKGTTTYYVIGYELDPTKVLQITEDVRGAIQKFADHVQHHNTEIMESHRQALKAGPSAAGDADGLDADWNNTGSDIED